MPEILDLYHRDGTPAGISLERGETAPEDLLWPVSAVWLVRHDGRLLIQKRSALKPNFPSKWCCSAGGAVQHGETPLEGALRETEEELGLVLDPRDGQLVFTVPGIHSLHQVWLFRKDIDLSDLTLQAEEVSDVRYVTPDELRELVSDGQFVRNHYLERLLALI